MWDSAGVAETVDDNKARLGLLSGCLLALVPWMQVSRAVRQQVALPLGALAAAVAAGVAIHLLYLAFNTAAVNALRLGGPGVEGELACNNASHMDLSCGAPSVV